MKKLFVGILVFIVAAGIGSITLSETVLIVSSASGDAEKVLALEDLLALEQVEITTSNEFVDGKKVFKGPLVRDILILCRASDAVQVSLIAANDYQVEVDAHEFFDYDAILALSMDGEMLSKRDKGPIWVIYPMSDHAELRKPVYNSRLIWQLVRMEYR